MNMVNLFKTVYGLFTPSSHKDAETKSEERRKGKKMRLRLNDTLNGLKSYEYGALSSQRFLDYPTPSSHKEEEIKVQSGGNGTKMVLPLNDKLKGRKRDEYGEPLQNCLWTIHSFISQRCGNEIGRAT